MAITTTTRPLFGGAMQCNLPSSFLDLSDIRPVPDNQETWFDGNNNSTLLVIEILEMRPEADPLVFYFSNLMEESGGVAAATHTFQHTQVDTHSWSGVGYYHIRQQRLCVHVGLLRLPEKQTDILLSLTTPSGQDENASVANTNSSTQAEMFQTILHSLRINDMSLFV